MAFIAPQDAFLSSLAKQSVNLDMHHSNRDLRERTAVGLSRVGWGFAVVGFLILLIGVPSAIYGLAGPNTSGWTVALFGLGFCVVGFVLGVIATSIGRGRHF